MTRKQNSWAITLCCSLFLILMGIYAVTHMIVLLIASIVAGLVAIQFDVSRPD